MRKECQNGGPGRSEGPRWVGRGLCRMSEKERQRQNHEQREVGGEKEGQKDLEKNGNKVKQRGGKSRNLA